MCTRTHAHTETHPYKTASPLSFPLYVRSDRYIKPIRGHIHKWRVWVSCPVFSSISVGIASKQKRNHKIDPRSKDWPLGLSLPQQTQTRHISINHLPAHSLQGLKTVHCCFKRPWNKWTVGWSTLQHCRGAHVHIASNTGECPRSQEHVFLLPFFLDWQS